MIKHIISILIITCASLVYAGEGVTNLQAQVKLYPNPTYTGLVNLEIDQIDPDASVAILVYNLIGEQVYAYTYSEFGTGAHEVNLTSEPQGTYFVNIVSEGEQITRRIALK